MDVQETLKYEKAAETPHVADVEDLLALLATIISRLLGGGDQQTDTDGDA